MTMLQCSFGVFFLPACRQIKTRYLQNLCFSFTHSLTNDRVYACVLCVAMYHALHPIHPNDARSFDNWIHTANSNNGLAHYIVAESLIHGIGQSLQVNLRYKPGTILLASAKHHYRLATASGCLLSNDKIDLLELLLE
jgi:hypothetical protein